jgi:hypothetical protein
MTDFKFSNEGSEMSRFVFLIQKSNRLAQNGESLSQLENQEYDYYNRLLRGHRYFQNRYLYAFILREYLKGNETADLCADKLYYDQCQSDIEWAIDQKQNLKELAQLKIHPYTESWYQLIEKINLWSYYKTRNPDSAIFMDETSFNKQIKEVYLEMKKFLKE